MKYLSIEKMNKKVIFPLFLLILFPIFRTEAVGINSSLPNLGGDSLKTGLVGYWTFDGTNMKSNVTDSSGSGNNGLLTNFAATSTVVTSGKLGQALKFDGVNDTVVIDSFASSLNKNEGTFSAWVYAISYTGGSPFQADGIIEVGSSASSNDGISLSPSSTGNVSMNYRTSGVTTRATITGAPLKKWYHVAGTWNSSTISIYLNGVLSNSVANGTLTSASLNQARIGSDSLGTPGQDYFDGLIDDVRIYNRALTVSEIKQIYNLSSSKFNEPLPNFGGDSLKTGLVGYWTFDGAKMKNNVTDSSGSGNNGNMTNFAATSTVVSPGKLGQALRFDGVDDVVTVSPSSSVNDLPTLTVAFWAKPESLGLGRTNVAKADNTSGGHGWRAGSGSGTASMFSFSVLGFVGGDLLTSSGAGAFVAGQWAHYVVTWDGTTQARGVHLYKNGVELAATYIDAGTATLQSDASRNIVLGRESGIGDNFFKGVMDDVRLYNRVLSASEIKQIYNLSSSKFNEPLPNFGGDSLKTGLVGYWTFDGAKMKNNVTDSSGSGNNGNMTNFAATSTVVSPGKLGQALRFDGGDDIVTTPQLSTGTGPFSISAWVKVDDLTGKSFNNGVGIIAHFNNDLAGDFALSITSGYSVSFLNNRTGGNDSTGESETSANVVSKNKWAHVVAVWDGSVNKIYVNGVSKTFTSSSWGDWGTESGLGRLANLSLYYYKGVMDDVRVYNRALTVNEISQIYKLGI